MRHIPYGKQTITEADKAAVMEVLGSPMLTQGPYVAKFEDAVKSSVQAPFACAVANGTAALHLSALALDARPGQKVLVATNSFAASANCIRYCGAEVEFADIDPKTYCLDLEAVEHKLESQPRGTYAGVVAVDFAGYPLDFERLENLANAHGAWVMEDACHALGARFQTSDGRWAFSGSGEFADLASFSFHPVKHIATGEGGMITTADAELHKRVLDGRTHGITKIPARFEQQADGPWYYEMQSLGFNYRMPDVLCALGASQMTRLSANLARRRAIARIYGEELSALPITLPDAPRNVDHAYHLYVILSERRGELYAFLAERGVHCQVHYIPIHTLPYYRSLYGKQRLKNAEHYYERALSLPMYHGLNDDDLGYVIEGVKAFFAKP